MTERGVCYGTSPAPTTADATVTTTGTTGAFTVDLTSLTPGTKYYVRAYAVNSEGTGYGSEVSFTTVPVQPSGFTATADGSSRIDLSWTPGDGAAKTMIRRSETPGHPTSTSEGDLVYFNSGTSTADTKLVPQHHVLLQCMVMG